LGERERDVLNLIGQGLSSRDIADRLALSEATVEGHGSHILDKLAVRGPSEGEVTPRRNVIARRPPKVADVAI
jgi:two-component system response regulator DevR